MDILTEAISLLKEEIEEKQKEIEKLKRFSEISEGGISEEQYHDYCKTNLRYSDMLGQVLTNSIPCLIYDKNGINYFHYHTKNGLSIRIPNSLYGVEIIFKPYIKGVAKDEDFLQYDNIRFNERMIGWCNEYLKTKSIIKKSTFLFGSFKLPIAVTKYLVTSIYTPHKKNVENKKELLLNKVRNEKKALTKAKEIQRNKFFAQEKELERIVPILLEWTQSVKVYSEGCERPVKTYTKKGKI